MGLNCYRTRDKFSELLDDVLSTRDRGSVLAHLASCERCAGDYELFRRSTSLVQGLNPIPVASDFTARVMSRVRAGGSAPRSSVRDVLPGRHRLPWIPYAVAAAAAAALAIGMWHWTALPRAKSGAIPMANQAATAPAARPEVAPVPQAGQLAATPAAVPGTTRLAARRPAGSGHARRPGGDTLYDQPFDGSLPAVPGYDSRTVVSAPADSTVHIQR